MNNLLANQPEVNHLFDNSVSGFIYFLEAVGYHGVFPGCYLRRCKIGLSRNPQTRLEQFHQSQPPCDLRLLRVIFVNNMAETEAKLHEQFASNKVRLQRSREWFDLNPVQVWFVQRAFDRYASEYAGKSMVLPIGTIMIGVAIALAAFPFLSTNSQPIPQLMPTTTTRGESSSPVMSRHLSPKIITP